MALDPSIALGIRPLEVPNQLAQYAQMAQVESAQRQNEVAQMQLEQLKQDRVEMQGFQKFLIESGDTPDLKQFATRLLRSPKHYEKGVEMLQKLREQDKFEETGRKLYPELFGAAPAGAGAMPMAAPTARPSGALGSGTFGMMPEPVNNLAPAPAAPSNALVAPVGKTPDQLRKEIMLFGGSNAPGAKNMVDMLKAQLTESLKQTDTQREMQSLGLPLTPEGFRQYKALSQTPTAPPSMVAEYTFAKTPDGGNFRGSYQDFVTARAAAGRAPRPEAAPRTQQVTMSDGTLGIMNMDTGAVTPSTLGGVPVKGKPSAFAEKTTAQRAQMGKDLGFAITQLSDITKDGGLIDQSTGSGAGKLADIGAGFVGIATPGAIAVGKIAPIADLVLKMVPRFEGPQSNKDTQSYKEAAGQLADASLPTAIRKEAGKTVLRIMTERKNQFVSSDMAAEGAGPAQIAPPAGFVPDQR